MTNEAMGFFRAKEKIVLIDGGLGTTLQDYGLDIARDPLWSGRVLVEQPEQLAQVHRAFVQAKCDVILTATYQLSIDNLMKCHQMSYEQAEEVMHKSVTIARQAIEDERASCYVAASIGPYGATLTDGSEFNGWYTDSMTFEQFKDWHRPRLAAVAAAEPDLIAFETIPSQKEAEALVALLKEFPSMKGWLSFNCQDSKSTAHGEPIEQAAASICLKSPDQIIAVGVNCVNPTHVVPLVERMHAIQRDLLAYPNAGVTWDSEKREYSPDRQPISPYIHSYLDAGIKYIGGCCHVNPAGIRAIRDIVDEHTAAKRT